MNPLDKIKFDKISIDEGLSQSVVYCVIQDSFGFIWFGTQDGLNKYDGRKITVYKNDRANGRTISNNIIHSLFEDNDKNLWIGTVSGLNRYDSRKDCFERFTTADYKDTFPVDYVRCIRQDKEGDLILATYGGGLTVFDFGSERFENFRHDPLASDSISYDKVNCIEVDSRGRLLIGTWGGGIDLFDKHSKKFTKISFSDNSDEKISRKRINHISVDNENKSWISTNGGLFTLDGNSCTAEKFSLPAEILEQEAELISFAKHDSSGNLWVGTREKGLWLRRKNENRFQKYSNDEFQPESISYDSVTCMYEDASNLLWVGTFGGGVNKFDQRVSNVLHFLHDPKDKYSINSNKISCFLQTNDGNVLIGTRENGISTLDLSTFRVVPLNEFDRFKSAGQNSILALEEDEDGQVWVGTSGGGLICYDSKTSMSKLFRHLNDNENSLSNDTVFAIKADKRGRIWIGTSSGLSMYDKSTDRFIAFKKNDSDPNSLGSDRVRSLCFDNDHNLWIATEYGCLNVLYTGTLELRRISFDDDLEMDKVLLALDVDNNGKVWIGSPSGLYRYDPQNKQVIWFSERDGLPNNFINSIIVDDAGFIWVSTNNGVAKLDDEGKLVKGFDKSDGFQSNEFVQGAGIKLKDGRIMFGGINGFNIFDPLGFNSSDFIPKVAFTEFRLFNRIVTPNLSGSQLTNAIWCEDSLKLTYRDSVISLAFAAMDFRASSKILYKYRLDGFDKDWINSGNSASATYTNLNPGEYFFRVMATNSEGLWNENESVVRIEISPPFWKTVWFKAVGAVTLVAAASAVYQNKLSKVRKEKEAQEEFTKKLIDAQESDRKRIAAELHDSIGHGLLISKNKLLQSLNESNLDSEAVEKIKDVSEILSGTLSEVREISYNLHPYQIERLGLSKAIR